MYPRILGKNTDAILTFAIRGDERFNGGRNYDTGEQKRPKTYLWLEEGCS